MAMNSSSTCDFSTTTSSATTTTKRHKHHHHHGHHHHHHHQHDDPLLIPGLPDHIAQLCLSTINPSLLFKVCHSWRRLIYSPSFPPFFSLYAILSPSPNSNHSHSIQFHHFDPLSNTWHTLPSPPQNNILLHHPSFLSRNLSVQSTSVSDNLILLAATTHNLTPALSQPLIFNPYKGWYFGSAFTNPRRWCAVGTSSDVVYMASGIGSHFSIEVAKSIEKWDPINSINWEKKTGMKDGRFSREAVDAVGWKGKLCMVNVKGDAAKEGVVYDIEEDTWKEMPEGMLLGFRGPVAAMEEEVMYVVDEGKGILSRYNSEDDVWEEILESQRFKGAEQMVAKRGRICVVSTAGISVVDLVAEPPRILVVDLPEGFEAVAVHILPRIPVTDFSNRK